MNSKELKDYKMLNSTSAKEVMKLDLNIGQKYLIKAEFEGGRHIVSQEAVLIQKTDYLFVFEYVRKLGKRIESISKVDWFVNKNMIKEI